MSPERLKIPCPRLKFSGDYTTSGPLRAPSLHFSCRSRGHLVHIPVAHYIRGSSLSSAESSALRLPPWLDSNKQDDEEKALTRSCSLSASSQPNQELDNTSSNKTQLAHTLSQRDRNRRIQPAHRNPKLNPDLTYNMAVPTPKRDLSSPYPFAAAPDIIRAHQKDAYFQGLLTNQLSDLIRRLRGARTAHAWASEARTVADALYLALTTLPGNRTLGEEYCDLVQVEEPSSSSSSSGGGPLLPSFPKRAALIASSTLLPYLASLLLPRFRSRLRALLQARLSSLARRGRAKTAGYRVQRYLLAYLAPLTSGSHLQTLVLAVFYFSGAYYTLSKRLLGLRYVFTTRSRSEPGGAGDRVGYEVLGVLLVVQMAVRAWLHLRATVRGGAEAELEAEAAIRDRAAAAYHDGGRGDDSAYASTNDNTELLPGGGAGQRSLAEIAAATHTPVAKGGGGGGARFDLGRDEGTIGWIKGRQQRTCTLCLEGLKDPAATQCGHVFCWQCIGDWVREKPECPLCRREAMVQHILPLRTA